MSYAHKFTTCGRWVPLAHPAPKTSAVPTSRAASGSRKSLHFSAIFLRFSAIFREPEKNSGRPPISPVYKFLTYTYANLAPATHPFEAIPNSHRGAATVISHLTLGALQTHFPVKTPVIPLIPLIPTCRETPNFSFIRNRALPLPTPVIVVFPPQAHRDLVPSLPVYVFVASLGAQHTHQHTATQCRLFYKPLKPNLISP